MDLAAVADELYAVSPEDFVPARDAAARTARAAGERELAAAIATLRRPTLSAWLVDRLARECRTELDALLALGARLRTVHGPGAGAEIRSLGERRRQAVGELVAAARSLAGRPLSATVEEEVAATLHAATADPSAAAAVGSGRLVKPLRYAGFGELPDLAEAVAVPVQAAVAVPVQAAVAVPVQAAVAVPVQAPEPTAGSRPEPAAVGRAATTARRGAAAAQRRRRDKLDQARAAARATGGAADDAQHDYERCRREAEHAAAAESLLAAELDALRQRYDDAAATAQATAAAAATAERVARAAHRAAEQARLRAARLERE